MLLHPAFEYGQGGETKASMVLCVESRIGEAGSEIIKPETRVLITKAGGERLDSFPWEM